MKNEKNKTLKVTIKPDFGTTTDEKRVYSNFLSVSHDPFAFTFTFCEARIEGLKKEELKEQDKEGAYITRAPIVSQIIIPVSLMPKIIEACQTNYKSFLEDSKKHQLE